MITEVREYLKSAPANRLNLPCAAESMGIPASTIRWGLRREGVCFLALKDAERKHRAMALLIRNRHADGVAVQRVTGLADAHASRSLQRWFGATLPELRGMI